MHRLFREELNAATGKSEFVIAQNVDIRGFSDWSLQVDSAQTALYIKKVYAKLIDRYFSAASFVKPTGDGLLVVEAFDEPDLQEIARRTVNNAMEIVDSFPQLCSDEDMVNFPVPSDVGIGISRGTASRLASAERTLDYSGRVLNLASRLMDLARPRGVVFDDGYGLNLLNDAVAGEFRKDFAYMKGVAESEPLAVQCWPNEIEIPPWHQRPLDEERWEHLEITHKLKDIQQMSFRSYRQRLDPAPLHGYPVEGEVAYPAITPAGNKGSGTRYAKAKLTRSKVAGIQYAHINLDELAAQLIKFGVKAPWEVTVKISYRIP
jgi:hypothetical protein